MNLNVLKKKFDRNRIGGHLIFGLIDLFLRGPKRFTFRNLDKWNTFKALVKTLRQSKLPFLEMLCF